jgi:hypothetical protein
VVAQDADLLQAALNDSTGNTPIRSNLSGSFVAMKYPTTIQNAIGVSIPTLR